MTKAVRNAAQAPDTQEPAAAPRFLHQTFQIHLNGPEMNRRGVRYRYLTSSKKLQAELHVAKLHPDVEFRVLKSIQARHCCYRMVIAYTEPTDNPNAAVWTPTSLMAFEASDAAWDELFGPLETAVLESIYWKNHEISMDEVRLISGKAIPVTTGD